MSYVSNVELLFVQASYKKTMIRYYGTILDKSLDCSK